MAGTSSAKTRFALLAGHDVIIRQYGFRARAKRNDQRGANPCKPQVRFAHPDFTFQTAHRSQSRLRDLAARCARVVDESFAQQRAWGMPGAGCTRGLACKVESTRVSHHRSTGKTRHSRTEWV